MNATTKKPQARLSLAHLKAQIAPPAFQAILWALAQALKIAALAYPQFRMRLKERNLVAQIKAHDENIGRWFEIRAGKVRSRHGQYKKPDITLGVKNAALGVELLTPLIKWLNEVNAQKDFKLTVEGPEELTNWFAQTLMMMQSVVY
jgi:trimethylamine-N-oxide reductase (cytochrome c)